MAGLKILLKILKSFRVKRRLKNSVGKSRTSSTSFSRPPSAVDKSSRVPSEYLADTIAYMNENGTADSYGDGPKCASLTELFGDQQEKAVSKLDCQQRMKIERVFEVKNPPETLEFKKYKHAAMARDEEANETNKVNPSWPYGKEVQEYYGTTVSSSCLSSSSSSSSSSSTVKLCNNLLHQCALCLNLKEGLRNAVTADTAEEAKENVTLCGGQKKAFIVCAVITGGKKVKPIVSSQRKVFPFNVDKPESVVQLPQFVLIYEGE